jgi:glutamate synthase (ferredoxin)
MAVLEIVGLVLAALVAVVAVHDLFIQRRHAILHNFPVVGHLRYFLERIGPELRQYWVSNDKEEMPFNRAERRWIYASAKGQNNNFGFGTDELLYSAGYPILKQRNFPIPDTTADYVTGDKTGIPCLKVMGVARGRARPFRPTSVVNISAMSFGSLGYRAISALNLGASAAGCYHNTGEGGVSPYHRLGGDLMWQLGTGYFGARDDDGRFSIEQLARQVQDEPRIRCIEVKLSQGAKPGKGGILPGPKVTKEIARTRGVPLGQDCISPNTHSEFSDVDGLIDFVERIAQETGLPVGIKSAIGEIEFWDTLAARMKARGQGPDFITVDGGEGGTGAAPLAFADHVSLPFKIGFARVYKVFLEAGLTDDIVWIGSGKLGFPDRAIVAFAMGCDIIQVAREAMLAIGCIQAQRCHTGHCPAGVATHSKWFQSGLNIEDKAQRFQRYVQTFRKELLSLSHACGYHHPGQFNGRDIELATGINEFSTLTSVLGYECTLALYTGMPDTNDTP